MYLFFDFIHCILILFIRLQGNDIMPNRRLLNLHPMSNEPIVSEVVPVDTPVISDSPTPDVIKEPESPVEKTDTPETPTPAEEILLSDEEVDEAIEAILKDMPLTVATEPTAFL